MSIINFKLDQLTEDVARLSRNNINDETQQIEESTFDKFNFPLKTIGELKDLDTYLEMADNKTKVRVIENWGVKPQTHDKTITGEVNCKCTGNEVQLAWIQTKKNFSALNIANVVEESVMKIHRKTITESDVESAIKGWLVKAEEKEEK